MPITYSCIYKIKTNYRLDEQRMTENILFSKHDTWESHIRNTIKGYAPHFHAISEIDTNGFDFIIPLTIHAQKYINNHLGHIRGKQTITPSNIAIDICNNKKTFSDFLIENGFEENTPKTDGNLDYPYILKRKYGEWGVGASIITGAESEALQLNGPEPDGYFRQEYIDGQEEYAAHIIVNDGEIIFSRNVKYTFQEKHFAKGKDFKPHSVETVDHKHLNTLFKKILNLLNYQGICCLDYKIKNNIVKIFEVNPRYGGSLTRFLNEVIPAYRKILTK